MAKAKRRQRSKAVGNGQSEQHARDLETMRSVNAALAQQPVDTAQLRKLAAVRGLVNSTLRMRVWPLLLGVELGGGDAAAYAIHAAGKHRDTQVVKVDVERSLWAFTKGWPESERQEKREQLQRLLTAVAVESGGDVCYYQGLHDIASVLLMTSGERLAYSLLRHLAACQLRDCTRSTMDAVLEQLPLVIAILQQTDEELAQCIRKSRILPYFSLSWYITWFAHNVQQLPQIARLFDLFMASHPLMPLYCGAVAMKAAREQLLAISGDGPEIHSALSKLSIVGALSSDELAQQAVALFKRCPPMHLLRKENLLLNCSVAPAACLEDGHWQVPEEPTPMGSRRQWFRHKAQWATAAAVSASTFALVLGASLIIQQLEGETLPEYLMRMHIL